MKKKKFVRPDDPYWNPDDENDYDRAYGKEEDESEAEEAPMVNELFLQAFIDRYQPEEDEHQSYVRAFSMGELRDALQIYRTFDCKSPDPLPYYLAALGTYGFKVKMGCCGEPVIPVSRRGGSPGAIRIE